MIDFERTGKITQEADETVADILNKRYDNFDQYQRVAEIQDRCHRWSISFAPF